MAWVITEKMLYNIIYKVGLFFEILKTLHIATGILPTVHYEANFFHFVGVTKIEN